MSRFPNTQRLVAILLQHGIPNLMIKIVEEQRIGFDDISTIDRDDIEHLFKNESGFTFRDRKYFWTTLQKIITSPTSNLNNDDVLLVEMDNDPFDVYEIDHAEVKDAVNFQHPLSNLSPKIQSVSDSRRDSSRNLSEFSHSDYEDNGQNIEQTATTSATTPLLESSITNIATNKTTSDTYFRYPVELPTFSPQVIKALESNDIKEYWKILLDEITRWIFSQKTSNLSKRETQAIGQSLYTKYPMLGKDGYRPWSYICSCITKNVRKERNRLNLIKLFT